VLDEGGDEERAEEDLNAVAIHVDLSSARFSGILFT